jgi:putative transcriptional regulator
MFTLILAVVEVKLMIQVRLDEILGDRGRSAYWLSKQTDISEVSLYKLRRGKTGGIQFDTLERICKALECTPGDLLVIEDEKPISKKKSKSKR